jgi:LysM repeat protein
MVKALIHNCSLIILCAVLSILCIEASAQSRMTREEYITKWGHLAVDNMEVYGIPASITMAQALLESGAGNSQLSKASNNHFGIKCKSTWEGAKVYHDDDEKGECFRAYPTVADSYHDHAEFLNNGKRYEFLFAYDISDYTSWAKGLKSAGYATAKDYAERLISLIEDEHLYLLDRKNGLQLYDDYLSEKLGLNKPHIAVDAKDNTSQTTESAPAADEVASKSNASKTTAYGNSSVDPNNHRISFNQHAGYNVYMTNGTHYIVAKEGDTFKSLGKKFQTSATTLRRYNDMAKSSEPKAGDIIYVERKMAKWSGQEMTHRVESGETLYSISQRYGIRLAKLAKMNNRSKSASLNEGEVIGIR